MDRSARACVKLRCKTVPGLLAPRSCQHLPARLAAVSGKSLAASLARPLPRAQVLSVRRYIEELPARLLIPFGLRLHAHTPVLASLECQSSPSSTARFKCMHCSAGACQSIETSMRA